MLKVIPRRIKMIFILTFLLGLLAFFLGLFFRQKLLIAYFFGNVVSIISNLSLLYITCCIVYENKSKLYIYLRYILSYVLYAIVLYFTYTFIETKLSILFCTLGILSFNIVMRIQQIINNKWE